MFGARGRVHKGTARERAVSPLQSRRLRLLQLELLLLAAQGNCVCSGDYGHGHLGQFQIRRPM